MIPFPIIKGALAEVTREIAEAEAAFATPGTDMQLEWIRSLACAVLWRAVEDARRAPSKRTCGGSLSAGDVRDARRFLAGVGRAASSLTFWCRAAQFDEDDVKAYARRMGYVRSGQGVAEVAARGAREESAEAVAGVGDGGGVQAPTGSERGSEGSGSSGRLHPLAVPQPQEDQQGGAATDDEGEEAEG